MIGPMGVPQVLALLLIGWPAILGSAALALAGIVKRRPALNAAAAALGTPFLLYLTATPRFQVVAPVVLALYWASAIAAAREMRLLTAVLVAPFLVLAAFVGLLVLSQP